MTTSDRTAFVGIRLTPDERDRWHALAARRGGMSQMVRTAVERLAAGGSVDGQARVEAETWLALRQASCRKLARQLPESDIRAALDVTNGWAVEAIDAALIHQEMDDAGYVAEAARIGGLSPADRATLTLACRWWWSLPEGDRPEPADLLARYGTAVRP